MIDSPAHLHDSQDVLVQRGLRLLPVPEEGDSGEGLHGLGLGVGGAGQAHGGRGQQAAVEVGGESVQQQLAVRGQPLGPVLPAPVPPVLGQGPGLSQLPQPGDEVSLVGADLEVGQHRRQVREVLGHGGDSRHLPQPLHGHLAHGTVRHPVLGRS